MSALDAISCVLVCVKQHIECMYVLLDQDAVFQNFVSGKHICIQSAACKAAFACGRGHGDCTHDEVLWVANVAATPCHACLHAAANTLCQTCSAALSVVFPHSITANHAT